MDRLERTLYSGGRLWDPAAGRYVEAAERDLQEVVGEPHIVGTTRDIARARQSNWVDALFHYRPPQVGFSRAEQLLLLRALRNEAGTDEELAAALGVSMPTVKRMWLSIYRRAAGLSELARTAVSRGTIRSVAERRSAAAFWPIFATIRKSCVLSRERPSRQEASRRRAPPRRLSYDRAGTRRRPLWRPPRRREDCRSPHSHARTGRREFLISL